MLLIKLAVCILMLYFVTRLSIKKFYRIFLSETGIDVPIENLVRVIYGLEPYVPTGIRDDDGRVCSAQKGLNIFVVHIRKDCNFHGNKHLLGPKT